MYKCDQDIYRVKIDLQKTVLTDQDLCIIISQAEGRGIYFAQYSIHPIFDNVIFSGIFKIVKYIQIATLTINKSYPFLTISCLIKICQCRRKSYENVIILANTYENNPFFLFAPFAPLFTDPIHDKTVVDLVIDNVPAFHLSKHCC